MATEISDQSLVERIKRQRTSSPGASEAVTVGGVVGTVRRAANQALTAALTDEAIERRRRLEEEDRLAREAREESAAKARLVAAGIPAKYRGVEARPVSLEVAGYRLHGPTGNGKSTLAAAILKHAIEHGAKGCWISTPMFVERMKSATRFGSSETTYSVLREYARHDWLVIDDLGKEREHDWDASLMQTLLWQAYDEDQKLIVTSNLSISEINSNNDALASRLAELVAVELDPTDRRKGKMGRIDLREGAR